MLILLTGARGRLGSLLYTILAEQHEVTGLDLQDLDISDFGAVRAAVREYRPQLVINCAAWTDVDGCARDPQRALHINGLGPQHLALAAHEAGAAVLQISSNEVFDGRAARPYTEYDSTAAVNPYGYSKLYAERAIAAVNPHHYIVRTSWLFAHGGRNFVQSILQAARDGRELRVVVDEVACPTYNDDLAAAIKQLIEIGRYGVYHLTNEGACSRYAFARHLLDRSGLEDVPIAPIAAAEWPRASHPPAYTALANITGRSIGITLRPWQQAVEAFLAREGIAL